MNVQKFIHGHPGSFSGRLLCPGDWPSLSGVSLNQIIWRAPSGGLRAGSCHVRAVSLGIFVTSMPLSLSSYAVGVC
jgi:hypothetical protein